jgi:hypothetical protein
LQHPSHEHLWLCVGLTDARHALGKSDSHVLVLVHRFDDHMGGIHFCWDDL